MGLKVGNQLGHSDGDLVKRHTHTTATVRAPLVVDLRMTSLGALGALCVYGGGVVCVPDAALTLHKHVSVIMVFMYPLVTTQYTHQHPTTTTSTTHLEHHGVTLFHQGPFK